MDENQETIHEVDTTKSSSFNPLIIVGIIVVLAIGGVALAMKKGDTQPTPSDTMKEVAPTQAQAMQENTDASSSTTTEGEISMEAGAFYYKPSELRVKKGQKVKIVMTSKDMMHDFNIDELNVKLPITKSGETNTVEFVPEKAGTFEYYCSVGQHRKNGQVGKIIVEE